MKPDTSEEGLEAIKSLKNNKVLLSYTILVKILNIFSSLFLPDLNRVISHFQATSSFPDKLNWQMLCQIIRKMIILTKETIAQSIFLSSTIKMFEKILFNEILNYIEHYVFRPFDRFLLKLRYITLTN